MRNLTCGLFMAIIVVCALDVRLRWWRRWKQRCNQRRRARPGECGSCRQRTRCR
jgi:hypothetical protein